MKRIFLSLCAIGAALLMVETVVRGSIPVDHVPALAWDAQSQLLIHRPHQKGVRYPDRDLAHPVRYSINAQGWNAQYDYPERDYSRHLAIVIGDSFVEALQVQQYDAMPHMLYHWLNEPKKCATDAPAEDLAWIDAVSGQHKCNLDWRVYSMGISGAPLSQYLQMARAAERKYHPDIIIVILVHNDFIESYERPDNQVYESFWHTDGVKMIGPKVYKPRAWSDVMASQWATGRLAIQTLSRMNQQPKPATWQMGVDVTRNLAQMGQTAVITDYLFEQFALMKSKTSLLFAMDGDRSYIESGEGTEVKLLNIVVQQRAAAHGLRFVDLDSVFTTDWVANHHAFSFPSDYHWNKYAHNLVAQTLLPMVVKQ